LAGFRVHGRPGSSEQVLEVSTAAEAMQHELGVAPSAYRQRGCAIVVERTLRHPLAVGAAQHPQAANG